MRGACPGCFWRGLRRGQCRRHRAANASVAAVKAAAARCAAEAAAARRRWQQRSGGGRIVVHSLGSSQARTATRRSLPGRSSQARTATRRSLPDEARGIDDGGAVLPAAGGAVASGAPVARRRRTVPEGEKGRLHERRDADQASLCWSRCPAKMPVRPTMVIELKTAARRRCRRRPRPTRSRAGRITVKNSGADDPTAMKGAPAMSTLGRPRDSCEAVVRAPPGKWAVFAFLCGDGLEGWRHLDGDEERGAPQTRHLIGRSSLSDEWRN